MKASNQIISILSAMGANPAAKTDKNGNITIRVNAPTIPTEKETEGKSNV